MNFKSLSIAASAAILSVSLMTGCGGSNSTPDDSSDVTTRSITGTAKGIGNLSGVTVEGLKADGTNIADCINTGVTGTYALSCSEMPSFIKVSTTDGTVAKDFGFDNALDGGDDELFTDTFLATVDGNVTNVTPLAYLQYLTTSNLIDIDDVMNEADIFVVVSAADVLKDAGLDSEEAYRVIALSIDENATLRRGLKTAFKISVEALKAASDRQVAKGGQPLENVTPEALANLSKALNSVVEAAEKAKTDVNSRKAVKTVNKKIREIVKAAKVSGISSDSLAGITKMTSDEAILVLTDIIKELVDSDKNADLEAIAEVLPEDGDIEAAKETIEDKAEETATFVDGTACNDNDDTTENDVYTNGVCAGTAIVPTTPVDGTPCDDNNYNTTDDKYTNGVCAGTAIDTTPTTYPDGTVCNDGNANTINDVYTNNVCKGTSVDVAISGTSTTFTKELITNKDANNTATTPSYKIVDQMLNIKVSDLNLSDNSNVNLSVCIKTSDANQSVTFSTTGGDVNNSKITFPEGTVITVSQNTIPSLGSIIGYESTATLDSALVNDDLSFNVKTVLNALDENDTKMEDAIAALDDFLANKDTYTMKIESNLLSETIVGTIKVDGGKDTTTTVSYDSTLINEAVNGTLAVTSNSNDTYVFKVMTNVEAPTTVGSGLTLYSSDGAEVSIHSGYVDATIQVGIYDQLGTLLKVSETQKITSSDISTTYVVVNGFKLP